MNGAFKGDLNEMGIIKLSGNTGKKREQVRLKELDIGESFSGCIKEFFETKSEKYNNTTTNAVFVDPDTQEETIVYGVGKHLSYLQERMNNNNVQLGTLITITRKEPMEGAKLQYYFEFSADTDVVMNVEVQQQQKTPAI